jgi:Flp pilus assembly protein TadB
VTGVVLIGVAVGLGCLGIVAGLRRAAPSLDAVAGTVGRPLLRGLPTSTGPASAPGPKLRIGLAVVAAGEGAGLAEHPRWQVVVPWLDITGGNAAQLVSTMLIAAGVGLLVPPAVWVLAVSAGLHPSPVMALICVVVAVPAGLALPLGSLGRRAKARRRHFRVVLGTFVDLVVLGLAGGTGVDGALLAASQVSTDWATRRMAQALSRARDSGQSPWEALSELGLRVGVPELVELSTSLQLAGTEGARIRQSLSARAVSLRRHEQADAETEAHAVTERMFLPGALLLVGFLVFVGYPALSRILGGF